MHSLPFFRRSRSWVLGAAVFSVGVLAAKADQTWASTASRTTLVELFTSEGCSSCPPADTWLNGLTTHPRLWQDFVPVAFPVDYWDHLGWKDRFASPQFTQRQRAYVAEWRGQSLYTPGFVVDGREAGSSGRAGWLEPSREKPGVLQVERLDGNRFALRFFPAEGQTGPFDGHLALLDCGVTVRVGRGENAGRELRHDFVARCWRTGALNPSGGETLGTIEVPDCPVENGGRRAVAAWVTRRGSPVPLQATGGWLEKRPSGLNGGRGLTP